MRIPTSPRSASTAGALLVGALSLLVGIAAPLPASAQGTYATAVPATSVRVVRAREHLDTSVLSSDGHKVGHIVDYMFDTAAPPHLAYVLVSTGGLLDIGGRIRAVPAAAMTMSDHSAQITLTRDQYRAIAPLPGDRAHYLSDPQTVATLDREYHVAEPVATSAGPASLVSFSELDRSNAYSAKNGRIGYIDDAWISLSRDRAPFIEITPTMDPFMLPGKTRYAVPMDRMQPGGDRARGFTFNVTAGELADAAPANHAPGVRVLQGGFRGDKVLQVTVPAVAAETTAPAAPASPTGYTSAQQNPAGTSASLLSAAQRIRDAFDHDPSLRSANLQVRPQTDRVVLRGSVTTEALRNRALERAEGAAPGVNLDSQITVQ